MLSDVRDYVQSRCTWQQYKSSSLLKNGTLMPLPIPAEPWQSVSIDFITGLPVSNGYDAIMNCVCRQSKRALFTPPHSTATAADTAKLFFNAVARHHGLPAEIISDRDNKFTSHFWQELMKLLGTKLRMTGRKRMDNDSVDHVGTIEYEHATLVNALTKMSPFQIDTGCIPRVMGYEATAIDTRNDLARNFVQKRR
ncbi:Reverse transcriptase-rnase h-integrase [Phytophthora megakarya]|uniref:Reverse transcriptase-rnase h-integrase n=1 Tax=Phytophthora megakarya TaxID=4795 RepID=A0A225WUR0_9STRA|nr:Reverse transcriptase-rnase h-integrase [Phytophthora megakarya]